MTPTFTGEIQLAGWSESHNGGCKVTFWLQSPDELEAFRALTVRKGNTAGHRFMAALVEIGDDEQPVPSQEVTPEDKPKVGPLFLEALDMCKSPTFQKHIGAYDGLNPRDREAAAAEWIKAKCRILTRRQLDEDQRGAGLFRTLIRQAFREAQRATA